MVAHKRIPHRLVRLMPGLHPLLVRFAGFHGFSPDWPPMPSGLPMT